MNISAFTLIKNAEKFQFPVIESINSLLPAVDHYLVNVGDSETHDLLFREFRNEPKVRLITFDWGGKEKGTSFISEQTNLIMNAIGTDYAFYLQADEVIHERDLYRIPSFIKECEKEDRLGITLKYLHFAGDPNHVFKTYEDGGDFYDRELRIFRNTGELVSFGDGQSFSSLTNGYFDPRGPQPVLHQKERFLDSDIEVFHYSYLRDRKKLLEKKKYLEEFYKISEPDRKENIPEDENGYFIDPEKTKEFKGSHPNVMLKYLEAFK